MASVGRLRAAILYLVGRFEIEKNTCNTMHRYRLLSKNTSGTCQRDFNSPALLPRHRLGSSYLLARAFCRMGRSDRQELQNEKVDLMRTTVVSSFCQTSDVQCDSNKETFCRSLRMSLFLQTAQVFFLTNNVSIYGMNTFIRMAYVILLSMTY